VIYLDSCAVLKLIRAEEHSVALNQHLASSGADMISSELTRVEVCRALSRERTRERTRLKTNALLHEIARLPLATVIEIAADLGTRTVRTLDALHLATARMLGPALTEFITYDERLAHAARAAGLPVITPGTN
jgi:predicted nucleic acid-binding protein